MRAQISSAPCSAARALLLTHCPRKAGRAGAWSGSGRRVIARADGDDNLASLFAEELKKRGIDSVDGDEGSPAAQQAAGPGASSTSKSPFPSATKTSPRARAAVDPELSDQRQRSIAMVNEGLEGLIPRASELLKLGSSIFLAFAPFILAISLLFGAIYAVFGDSFVHGGDSSAGVPAYVDPATLLSEPTVDPYIPYSATFNDAR